MEPGGTLTAIAVVIGVAAGFGAGWGLKPDQAVKALEAQTEAIAELNAGHQDLVQAVQATALIESESEAQIAERLTSMPPQCQPALGGDPMSPICQWAWCLRSGETAKQRCQDTKLMDLIIEQWQAQPCPEPAGATDGQ